MNGSLIWYSTFPPGLEDRSYLLVPQRRLSLYLSVLLIRIIWYINIICLKIFPRILPPLIHLESAMFIIFFFQVWQREKKLLEGFMPYTLMFVDPSRPWSYDDDSGNMLYSIANNSRHACYLQQSLVAIWSIYLILLACLTFCFCFVSFALTVGMDVYMKWRDHITLYYLPCSSLSKQFSTLRCSSFYVFYPCTTDHLSINLKIPNCGQRRGVWYEMLENNSHNLGGHIPHTKIGIGTIECFKNTDNSMTYCIFRLFFPSSLLTLWWDH